MKFASLFLLAITVTVVVGDAIPPPLGTTPPTPDASAPALEVVRTYLIPNPEEVAVDPTRTFFVSGTNDGYVSKVDLSTGAAETIFSPKDFRPKFFANSTDNAIRSLCDGSDLSKENTCGRILGVKFELDADTGACKSIWMANAYYGIYEGSCGEPWTLKQRGVSIEGGFVNDIEPRGKYLYYTITHSTKQRNQLPYVILDDEAPSGSFHRLDTTNNYSTETLAEGMYFANGLASSTDGASIYISETTAARIRRYDISSGSLEPFLENIPVLTDNIIVQDGDLLVPGYTRNAIMEALWKDPIALHEFLAQGPAVVIPAFQAMIAPHGNLLIYEEATGVLKERIFQKDGTFALASSVHKLTTETGEPNGYLVGSVFAPAATWFRVVNPRADDFIEL